MKSFTSTLFRITLIPVVSFTLAGPAHAGAIPGQPAPNFTATDAKGKTKTLADLKGKWTVLEWFNKDCPYVKKHYDSGNMQKLQKAYVDKGVNWFTVISSAKGKQGHQTDVEALQVATKYKAPVTAANYSILLDADGKMGKSYDAKTTPHMYIINPEGKVVYAGAIDDNDSANADVIPKSTNYVATALDLGLAGKTIAKASSTPYGCSVKY